MYVLEGPQTVSPPTRAQALPTQLRGPLKPTQPTGPQRRPVLLLKGPCFFLWKPAPLARGCGPPAFTQRVCPGQGGLPKPRKSKQAGGWDGGESPTGGAGLGGGRRGRGPGGQGQRLLSPGQGGLLPVLGAGLDGDLASLFSTSRLVFLCLELGAGSSRDAPLAHSAS